MLIHRWWEYKLVQPMWKTVWKFLKKLRTELPYYSAIPLLGIYLKKTKTLIWKDTCTPLFIETLFILLIAVLFIIAKTWNQPKCPSTYEWIKKCGIHTHVMKYYSAIKKSEIMPFAAMWMELEGIMLSEISQRKTNTI